MPLVACTTCPRRRLDRSTSARHARRRSSQVKIVMFVIGVVGLLLLVGRKCLRTMKARSLARGGNCDPSSARARDVNRSVSPYRAEHMSERRDRVTSSLSNFRDRRNRSNQNTSPHPDSDLFSDYLFRYVAIVRPLLFSAEMIPAHANSASVNSHGKLITWVKKTWLLCASHRSIAQLFLWIRYPS